MIKLKPDTPNRPLLWFIGISTFMLLWLFGATRLQVNATPSLINTYSDCPPQSSTIQVWLDEGNSPTGEAIVRTIPFDSGTQWYYEWFPNDGQWRWVEYDNYLRGVLGGEVGIENFFDEDVLITQAILARTKAYHLCGLWPNLPAGTNGIWGQQTQEYRYHHVLDFNNPQTYQNAVDFGNNPYVTYNNDTFDVQYRDRGDERNDYRDAIHTDIYDPPGQYYNDTVPGNTTGFLQYNANVWAKGEGPDNALFSPWDYCRLLAHFYTGIHLDCLNTTLPTPDDYRFNILHFGGMDDRADNPLILRTGQTYPFSFIVQNTGKNNWSLQCYGSYPWHDTALSFHWYSYPNKQYLSPQNPYFEGSRTGLCGSTLAPGKEYPDQSQSSSTAWTNMVVQVPPGEYWLRLDVEFRSAYVWGSRLHPQNNPNNAQWPTQDLRVQVILNTPPAPVPNVASGQTAGVWSPNNTVNLTWAAVNDPLVTHYRVCRDKRNDGQGSSCSNESGTSYARTLSDGIYDFEVTAIASDGKNSDTAAVDNLRLDATPPTSQLNPLPVRIQAPDYVLNWSSGDIGGSGLAEQQLTYQINNDGIWRIVSEVSNDVDMRSIRFYFPGGQQGDVYEFCLRTRDGANSWSTPSCDSTTYNPDPELHVEPLQLTWYTVYSNTVPNTQTLTIENYGGYILDWAATTPFTLAALSQTTGTAPSVLPVVLTHPMGITATYQGYITVTGTTPGTHNSPQVIPVTIYVREKDNMYYFPIIFKQQ